MQFTKSSTLFKPGQLAATPAVLAAVPREELFAAYARHLSGDWGDVSEQDKRSNDWSVRHQARILSAYCYGEDEKFWIITEADRSATTFLLPSDY